MTQQLNQLIHRKGIAKHLCLLQIILFNHYATFINSQQEVIDSFIMKERRSFLDTWLLHYRLNQSSGISTIWIIHDEVQCSIFCFCSPRGVYGARRGAMASYTRCTWKRSDTIGLQGVSRHRWAFMAYFYPPKNVYFYLISISYRKKAHISRDFFNSD